MVRINGEYTLLTPKRWVIGLMIERLGDPSVYFGYFVKFSKKTVYLYNLK